MLEAIEARRDADAAGVLAALAVLAAEPLAAQARASAQRLAGEGIVVARRGRGRDARRRGGGADRGPGRRAAGRAAARGPARERSRRRSLGIEHQDTGGALVRVRADAAGAGQPRRATCCDGVDGAARRSRSRPTSWSRACVAAAHRAIDAEVALGPEAGPALPIVSRALTGDPTGLPRPAVLAPWEDDDHELIVDAADDEEGFHRVMETLLDELEQHARATYPPGGVVWQHGDFVASTMLQWKGGYDDGRLGRWTQADLAEYLLDYFPRKVSVDDETLAAVPECVARVPRVPRRARQPLRRAARAARAGLRGAARRVPRTRPRQLAVGPGEVDGHADAGRRGSTRARPARSTPGWRTSTPDRASSATRSSAPPPTA